MAGCVRASVELCDRENSNSVLNSESALRNPKAGCLRASVGRRWERGCGRRVGRMDGGVVAWVGSWVGGARGGVGVNGE